MVVLALTEVFHLVLGAVDLIGEVGALTTRGNLALVVFRQVNNRHQRPGLLVSHVMLRLVGDDHVKRLNFAALEVLATSDL